MSGEQWEMSVCNSVEKPAAEMYCPSNQHWECHNVLIKSMKIKADW